MAVRGEKEIVLSEDGINEMRVRLFLDTSSRVVNSHSDEIKKESLFWNCKSLREGQPIANNYSEFVAGEGQEITHDVIKNIIEELIDGGLGYYLALDILTISKIPGSQKRDIIGWMRTEKKG